MSLSKNDSGSLGLLLSAFIVVLVAGIAIVASSGGSALQVKKSSSRNLAAVIHAAGTPFSPTSLNVTDNGDLSISATWVEPTKPGDFPVTSYVFYYSTVVGKDTVTQTATTDKTNITVSGLTSGVSYDFYVAAVNKTGEGADSEPVTLVISEAEPVEEFSFSDVLVSVAEDGKSANLSWATSAKSFYSLVYSPINNSEKGKTLVESKESAESHSLDISNLATCSKYFYFLDAIADSEGGEVTQTSGQFSTAGCKGGSTILSITSDNVTDAKSASLQTNGGTKRIAVAAPAALKAGQPDVFIQAAKLEKESVKNAISAPTGKIWAGDAYSLKAFDSEVQEINESFDKDVEVSIDVAEADVADLDFDSLTIYHYEDGSGWQPLSSCSKEISGGIVTITCTTTSFSIFGVFGNESTPEPEPESQGGGSSSGSLPVVVTEETPVSNVENSLSVNSSNNKKPEVVVVKSETKNKGNFTKDLWFGLKDAEVKALQQSLNQLGFELSKSGAGSAGSETEYFGPLTKAALIKFQEAHKKEVLSPYGLTSGTGYFGPYSRATMKILLEM